MLNALAVFLLLLIPIISFASPIEFKIKGGADVQSGFNKTSDANTNETESFLSGEVTARLRVAKEMDENKIGVVAKMGANTDSKRYMNKPNLEQYSAFWEHKKGKFELGKSFGIGHIFQTGTADFTNADNFHPISYSLLSSTNNLLLYDLQYDHDLLIMKPGLWSEQPYSREKDGDIDFVNKRSNVAKANYTSPAIGGFRFGTSYIPNASSKPDQVRAKEGFKDIIQMGAIFAKQFENFALKTSLVAEYGEATDNNRHKLKAIEYGVNLSYMGFNFGASYGTWGKSGLSKAINANKNSDYWSTGLAYSISHISLRAAYFSSNKRLSNNNSNNALQDVILGVDYRILPNFTIYGQASRQKLKKTSSIANPQLIKSSSFLFGSKVTF